MQSGPAIGSKDSRHFRSRWLRNLLVSVASLVVLVLASYYVFGAAQTVLADELTVSSIPGTRSVFYGKVTDTAGKPLYRAKIVIFHYNKGRKVYDGYAYTGRNGTYRKVTQRRGTTYVQISAKVGARTVASKLRRLEVRHGKAYRLNAHLVRRSAIIFLPLFTY